MAQVTTVADTYSTSVQAPTNRISIPFFRVQERKWLLGTIDVAIAAAWLVGAYYLWKAWARPIGIDFAHISLYWVIGGAGTWLVVSWVAGAYELDTADHFWSAARVTLSVGIVELVLSLGAYYAFLKSYPRPALALAVIGAPATVLVWRALYASVLRRPAYATRLLIVGNAALCTAMADAATGREDYYRVLGFAAENPVEHPSCLGDVTDLDAIASRYHAHRIVVAPRQSMSDRLVNVLSGCIERGIDVVDFNAAYEEIAEKVAVEHAGDYWLAALPTRSNSSSLEEAAMRMVDILGASVGLAISVLLAPFIALAIVVESGPAVIYRQERLGRSGKPFTLYKFRSMRIDAESEGACWAAAADKRATRVGRFLRRTHLDELPQFWNVLRGDMSLVGPRPERPTFTDELTHTLPFYRLRLAVRPGLTGLKQIRVGYAGTVDEHLEVLRHDLYYIKHRSLALNFVIMARTIASVLGMEGR